MITDSKHDIIGLEQYSSSLRLPLCSISVWPKAVYMNLEMDDYADEFSTLDNFAQRILQLMSTIQNWKSIHEAIKLT